MYISALKSFLISLGLIVILTMNLNATEKPLLTFAGIENYVPYSYIEGGELKGLYNDIIKELYSRLDYQIKIELLPFKRVLKKTKKGTNTGMIGALYTAERGKFAKFIKDVSLTKISTSLFVRKDSLIQSATVSQIEGLSIGRKRGFIMSTELEEASKEEIVIIKNFRTAEQLVKMLILRRLDGFIHTTGESLFYINKHDTEKKIHLLKPHIINEKNTYFSLSKIALNHLPKNFFSNTQKTLRSMQNDGTLKKLHQKYGLPYSK